MTEKPRTRKGSRFVAELTNEEQEALERLRASLGLRSKADVLRWWIRTSPPAGLAGRGLPSAPSWAVPTPPAPTLQPGTCHVRAPAKSEGYILEIPDVDAELINGLPNNTSGGVFIGRPTAKPGSLLKKGKGK